MSPEVVHVVVPAHDEERLLSRCLAALELARAELIRRHDAPQVRITVVLDRCRDASAAVAAEHGVDVVAVDAQCVGIARAVGAARAEQLADGLPDAQVWVATTDADSWVPPGWLVEQADLARAGVELFVGRVQPEPEDLPAAVLRRWWRDHRWPGPLHVHGANLGFTLAAYRRAGGFPPVAEHEDVLFAQAAIDAGCVWTDRGPWVHTSGRTSGRAPGGFSGYVRALVAETGEATGVARCPCLARTAPRATASSSPSDPARVP